MLYLISCVQQNVCLCASVARVARRVAANKQQIAGQSYLIKFL